MQLQTFIYDMHVNKKIYLNCIQDIFSRCQEYMKYFRWIFRNFNKIFGFYIKKVSPPSFLLIKSNLTSISKPMLE